MTVIGFLASMMANRAMTDGVLGVHAQPHCIFLEKRRLTPHFLVLAAGEVLAAGTVLVAFVVQCIGVR
jgi:hypothetical protein